MGEKEFKIKSTRCYDHTDTKSTLIEATVEKIQLPIDLLRKETIGFIYFNYKTCIRISKLFKANVYLY